MLVKIGPKGQIVIPKAFRQALDLSPGDSVALVQVGDDLLLRPVRETIFDLVGSIAVDEPQDFAVLREEAKKYIASKVLTNDE